MEKRQKYITVYGLFVCDGAQAYTDNNGKRYRHHQGELAGKNYSQSAERQSCKTEAAFEKPGALNNTH